MKLCTVFFILIGAAAVAAVADKPVSVYRNRPEERNPNEGKRVRFVEDPAEAKNADGLRGHLEAIGEAEYHAGLYEKLIKRSADVILSLTGLLVLSPVFLALSIWIYIDDPGPVLFTQKRVGRNKQYFRLHKFRSMKRDAPHSIPTHMLRDSDRFVTRSGRFMRFHSLDELPQLWDILLGNMSVVGPRPGLWNQDFLTSERDRYGANDVRPGLTGWAQINGRDELEIPEKAKLDGVYVAELKKGGMAALRMDMQCFLGSLRVFGGDTSIADGGSGKTRPPHAQTRSDDR